MAVQRDALMAHEDRRGTRTPLWAVALVGIAANWVASFLLIVLSIALGLKYHDSPDVPLGIVAASALNAPGLLLVGLLPFPRDAGLLAAILGSALSGAIYGVAVQYLIRWRQARRASDGS